MKIEVNTSSKSYEIALARGSIKKLGEYIDCNKKIMVITDDNVSKLYLNTVMKQLKNAYFEVVSNGEESKSFKTYEYLTKSLLNLKFSRNDLIIALGGGVIGDLAGFVASTYKRGIDFINIPTTTLAQIDSSIGGKVAINVDQIKNCVGSFHQPSKVIIDFDTLNTLTTRHFNNGLVEAVKAGLIQDKELFELFESDNYLEHIEEIIYRSLVVKKKVVEKDEYENNIRKILNFGHTIGHGFESYFNLEGLYHGEAVACGMMKIIKDEEIKDRLKKILDKLSINTDLDYDLNAVYSFILSDKKANNQEIEIIDIESIGKAIIKKVKIESVKEYL